MEEFDIVYRDIKLRIICKIDFAIMIKNHLKGHAKFYEPYGNATYTLNINEDNKVKPGKYGKIIDKWFNYATADCYIDNQNKICYLNNICADGIENLTLLIQYFAGNVLNRLLEIKGYIAFHSSCVEKDGNGIVFVAGRNSGKTVCMLNMMHYGWNNVTNDKSAINEINGEFNIYGIAQSVSIRMSKEFRSRPENQKYIEYGLRQGKKFSDKNMLEGNNIIINDIYLAQLNNVKQVEDAILKTMFVPKYNPELKTPTFNRMTEIEILKTLREQLLPLVHDTTIFLKNMHLEDEFVYNPEIIINKLTEIPCYYCEQNENTTEKFVENVRRLSIN